MSNNPAWLSRLGRAALVAALALSVASCASKKNRSDPLKGERIAILTFQQSVEADPLLADTPVSLPRPYTNANWAQPGGSTANAMYHLTLPDRLNRAWKTGIGKGSDNYARLIAEPVVADGTLYTIDTIAKVTAIDAANGRVRWSNRLEMKGEKKAIAFGGGLAVHNGTVYATTGYGFIAALNATTGVEQWRRHLEIPIRGAPTVANGRVFVSTHDNQLYALNAETGVDLWDMVGIVENAGILGSASPAVSGDTVIAAFSSGELFALQADNGRVNWQDALSRTGRLTPLATLADIDGQPVIDRGRVFAISHAGRMVSIDMRTGERVWETNVGSSSTPWIAGDFIFVVTTEGAVACVSTTDGRVRWVTQLQRYKKQEKRKGVVRWFGPVLASDRLIVVSSHGYVLSISPYTGEVLSGERLGDASYITPVVADNSLYVLTNKGDVVAYR